MCPPLMPFGVDVPDTSNAVSIKDEELVPSVDIPESRDDVIKGLAVPLSEEQLERIFGRKFEESEEPFPDETHKPITDIESMKPSQCSPKSTINVLPTFVLQKKKLVTPEQPTDTNSETPSRTPRPSIVRSPKPRHSSSASQSISSAVNTTKSSTRYKRILPKTLTAGSAGSLSLKSNLLSISPNSGTLAPTSQTTSMELPEKPFFYTASSLIPPSHPSSTQVISVLPSSIPSSSSIGGITVGFSPQVFPTSSPSSDQTHPNYSFPHFTSKVNADGSSKSSVTIEKVGSANQKHPYRRIAKKPPWLNNP